MRRNVGKGKRDRVLDEVVWQGYVDKDRAVSVWYLCRFIGCLDDATASSVLYEIGRNSFTEEADPQKRNALVLIGALRDFNPRAKDCTSVVRTKEDLMRHLAEGAGRDVTDFRDLFEERWMYFSKYVSALTIRVK